jgi:hypothetical protein
MKFRFHFTDETDADTEADEEKKEDKKRELCDVSYEVRVVKNPIGLETILVKAAAGIGLCVATKFVWATCRIVNEAYEEVKEEEKAARTITERAYHTTNKLPAKRVRFQNDAITALKGCVQAEIGDTVKGWFVKSA